MKDRRSTTKRRAASAARSRGQEKRRVKRPKEVAEFFMRCITASTAEPANIELEWDNWSELSNYIVQLERVAESAKAVLLSGQEYNNWQQLTEDLKTIGYIGE